MLAKYAQSKFIHGFPFTIHKGDEITDITVNVYQQWITEREIAIVAGAQQQVGYINGSKSVVFNLANDEDLHVIVRGKGVSLVTDEVLIGKKTWVPLTPEQANVRLEFLGKTEEQPTWGGTPGKTYTLEIIVKTLKGNTVKHVEEITINQDLKVGSG